MDRTIHSTLLTVHTHIQYTSVNRSSNRMPIVFPFLLESIRSKYLVYLLLEFVPRVFRSMYVRYDISVKSFNRFKHLISIVDKLDIFWNNKQLFIWLKIRIHFRAQRCLYAINTSQFCSRWYSTLLYCRRINSNYPVTLLNEMKFRILEKLRIFVIENQKRRKVAFFMSEWPLTMAHKRQISMRNHLAHTFPSQRTEMFWHRQT